MATIIQFPNSISFLENLKAVRIASSETVAFKLSSGGSTILEETYSPGPSGVVEVELRDVISDFLSIAYPSSGIFTQTSAIAQMTVNVDDGTDQSFTVLSGGVRGLSTTDESFLRANWLTWQPQTKTVRWNQPEHLTFAHLSAGTVKVKFYPKAGGSETVTLHSASAGQVNTYRTQMSTLFALSSHDVDELYGIVDVWVENGGTQQSYVQRYVCTPETRDEHYFSCVNSLGGVDTFCFTGARILSPSVEHASALRGDSRIDITPEPGRSWTQGTGDLDRAESRWIWDFFNSSRRWAEIDGALEEIVIESSSVRASDAENLNAFDFTFSPVKTGRTMKIDRTAGQLPPMEVPSPDGDLFFLAPRIVDYPDATINGSLLLLTQSPLAQEWRKIGIGPLCDYLSDQIHQTQWGQLAHTHGNKAVIDALSEQDGQLLFNGEPVTPVIPEMPDHYIAGTKAKTAASDDALTRVTAISFTAAASASESVDLEVVTINGQRFLHTSLPFFSDSEITAGGVGSGETPGPATTLGALLNVDSEADDTPTTDKILVREAGSTHWTITDLADISGAVAGIRMNGTVRNPGTDKIVDLGTVITSLEGYATEAYVSGNYLASSQKGAANGVASLDGSGKILFAQLPDAILGQLLYGGTVNASGVATLSTDVKTKLGISAATVQLTNDAGTYGYGKFEGVYFIMSADSGFASLGLKVGDWLISTGSAWKKIANTDAVTGVKGDAETDYRIGNVNITKANIGLGNVENTALSTWAGSANITTLGTVSTGVWHGTAIADSYIASAATWNALKTLFESMFERHGSGTDADPYTIKAKYALWSPFEITAGGVGSGGGGATGTLSTLLDVKHSSDNVVQRLSGGDVQTGDLFLKGDSTHWYALAKGNDGQILKMINGLPSWGDAPATGVTSISVNSGAAQTGAVSLTVPTKTSDITNDSGFISGITSSMVTSALGYTPYNASNPLGYLVASDLITLEDCIKSLQAQIDSVASKNDFDELLSAAITTGSIGPVKNAILHDGYTITQTNGLTETIRDFSLGTLVRTSIDYSQSNGDSFYVEIKGNTYTDALNSCFTQIQGYILNNTIICYGVTHLGVLKITPITAMNLDGKLCFWFPRLGYWMGFDIRCYRGVNYAINTVTAIENSGDPGGTKRVALNNEVATINTQTIRSQSVAYAAQAGSIAWGNVSGRPTALSQFTDDIVNGHYLPLSGGTMSGNITLPNSVTLKGENSTLTVQNSFGKSQFGTQNISHCQIYTNAPDFYFNKSLHVEGDIYATGEVTAGSDARWKANIKPIAENPIMLLKPCEWDWNEGHGNGHSAGLIAQEVLGILPYAVRGNEKDGYTLNYNIFHAYEIAAIQHHETEIEKLRHKINALEKRLNV